MKELLSKEKYKTALFKKSGYDIARARDFILTRSQLSNGSLLEIGTGKWHFTLSLARKGFNLTSIDSDPGPQKLAMDYLKKEGLGRNVHIQEMDAEDLRFSRGFFENIISVNFMHHANKPISCLREMVRVARKKIVIADVNKSGAAILKKIHQQEGHRHPDSRISFERMRDFLKNKGFFVKTYKGFCQTVLVAERSRA